MALQVKMPTINCPAGDDKKITVHFQGELVHVTDKSAFDDFMLAGKACKGSPALRGGGAF